MQNRSFTGKHSSEIRSVADIEKFLFPKDRINFTVFGTSGKIWGLLSISLTKLLLFTFNYTPLTRMHSSRMRTVHNTQWPLEGGVCAGGCLPGECLPGGISAHGVSAREGVCPGGRLPGGSVPVHAGIHPRSLREQND